MPADLAALVAAPWWQWMPGALAELPDVGLVRILMVDECGVPSLWRRDEGVGTIGFGVEYGDSAAESARIWSAARPAIGDHATRGCLLAVARLAWADPTLFLQPCDGYYHREIRTMWRVSRSPLHECQTYFALNAEWCDMWTDICIAASLFVHDAEALVSVIIAAPPPEGQHG